MTERIPPHHRLLRRFRVRAVRDIQDLDARDRLGHPPRPLLFSVVIYLLIVLLGLLTFGLGRAEGVSWGLLLGGAVVVFGIATAVGSALAVSEYRSLQDADRAREELLRLQSEAERARREAGARLHDARALTAGMGAALHALERSGADRRIVEALSEQVQHLIRLLSAPREAGLEPVVVSEVLLEVGSFAALHGVTLLHEAADGAVVMANRQHLLAILQNLVDNARKYAPGSPVLVTCEPGGPYLKIILEDRGPGLAGTDPESLFLAATRGGAGTQGFGMGLSISRRLAEGMGGALWHEPPPGRGSRFVLKLPRPPGAEGVAPGGPA